MKLLRAAKGKWEFHLDANETRVLRALLDRYPVIPSARPGKSGAATMDESTQRLLDEALAEQRRENKDQITAFLQDERRFKSGPKGSHLNVSAVDIEWLLQVLNDVRVGSWIQLGSPEQQLWELALNEVTSPLAWTMEAAAHFQMQFITAFEREGFS